MFRIESLNLICRTIDRLVSILFFIDFILETVKLCFQRVCEDNISIIANVSPAQEGHLKDVKYLMRAKAPLAESAGKLIKLLDELIIDLNQPLLELPQKNITELDKKLYALRDDEMVSY